jgi:hypothetical protein
MTMTEHPYRIPDPNSAEGVRRAKATDGLRTIAHALDVADGERMLAQDALEAAIVGSHGSPASGGLSYDEISKAIGRSKGRVIQIVRKHRSA